MKKFVSFLKDENGQGMVEYGLIIGFVAIVVVGLIVVFGDKIKALFTNVGGKIGETNPFATSAAG